MQLWQRRNFSVRSEIRFNRATCGKKKGLIQKQLDAIILFFCNMKNSQTRKQCAEKPQISFNNRAPSSLTLKWWYSEVHRGRISLWDEGRDGRVPTAVTGENSDAICAWWKGKTAWRATTFSYLLALPGVRPKVLRWQQKFVLDAYLTSLRQIVTGGDAKIYCDEPGTKRQSVQWIFPGKTRPIR